ncbi:MAG: VOC family protein [Pseudomonadota bacterium]
MISGLNHITLAITDLTRAVEFYRDVLGCEIVSLHDSGAYFQVGDLWLCLCVDSKAAAQSRSDYTHIAFSIASAEFAAFEEKLARLGVPIWQENRSEGRSVYFCDPDGHKLEVHVGTLESRLAAMNSELDDRRCGCAT